MGNNKEKISKLSQEGEENVSGGYIVQVDPVDLKEMHLDFKPYLVIDPKTHKVLGSYETKDEAIKKDYWLSKIDVNFILDKGELKNRIFTNGNGDIRYIR